jgi:hypothetical protein
VEGSDCHNGAVLKRDIFRYYSNPDAPIRTKQSRKRWADVQKQLEVRTTIPTGAGRSALESIAYESIAALQTISFVLVAAMNPQACM